MQVVNPKIANILKFKKDYSNLPAKKIENIYKLINNLDKLKSKIKMTTKDLLYKQIIVPISKNNMKKFIASSNNYIANLNRALKNIKSDILADYIHSEQSSITIITNKIASLSNLQIIEKYVKNIENINFENIKTPQLP